MQHAQQFHELKTWPEYFDAVLSGHKRFELRANDRDFQTGDYVKLIEFNPDPETGGFTGRGMYFAIGFILNGPCFGLPAGHCIFGLENADYNDLMNFLSDHPEVETKLPLTYSLEDLPF